MLSNKVKTKKVIHWVIELAIWFLIFIVFIIILPIFYIDLNHVSKNFHEIVQKCVTYRCFLEVKLNSHIECALERE